MRHTHIHNEYTEGCFACKVLSVNISASATPNRANLGVVVDADAREVRWNRDMPAYKRLRSHGIQPKGIDGSAELEAKAADKLEIEMGHLFPDKHTRKRVVEAMGEAQELSAE